jgi:hypothetical protein
MNVVNLLAANYYFVPWKVTAVYMATLFPGLDWTTVTKVCFAQAQFGFHVPFYCY